MILACSLAVLACCKPQETPVDPQPVEPQPETRTLTFVLPSHGEEAPGAMKTAWQAGDKIVVHGEYSKNQVIVTLAEGDISSDGRSATKTVDGLYPYKREDCTSTLYASYPAEVSDNLNHCFFYSKFSSTESQILAACNEGDTFNFQDICGVLSFSLEGDYDSYSITGARKEALGYEFLQVKLTDNEQNYKQYLGSPVVTIEGPVVNGCANICMPDGISASGCTIKFKKDGKFVSIFKSKEAIEIARGQVTDMGDITEAIAEYDDPFSGDIKDIDANGSANCYIVTEPGVYKFKAVKGNNATAFLQDVADAAVLWETWNDDSEVVAGSIITTVSFAEDYMIFHTPDALRSGNAVIAAKDMDGNILWSWHIWVPETTIATGDFGGICGTTMMDRNLGALVAAQAGSEMVDVHACGMTYQWGRKDPFVGPASMTSTNNATVAGMEVSETKGEVKISLEESIANPTLMGHTNSGDWITDFDNSLWRDDEKTIYDPCPAGWRVPASNASYPIFSGATSAPGWEVNLNCGWIKIGNPATVFPIGGYRDDYGPSEMAKVCKRVAIWTSSISSDIAGQHLNWRPDGGTFATGGTGKARGCYVRCVAE